MQNRLGVIAFIIRPDNVAHIFCPKPRHVNFFLNAPKSKFLLSRSRWKIIPSLRNIIINNVSRWSLYPCNRISHMRLYGMSAVARKRETVRSKWRILWSTWSTINVQLAPRWRLIRLLIHVEFELLLNNYNRRDDCEHFFFSCMCVGEKERSTKNMKRFSAENWRIIHV